MEENVDQAPSETEASNPISSDRSGEAIAGLLNTGSEKSFITEKVAKSKKRNPLMSGTMSLHTLGKVRPELVPSTIYKVEVRGEDAKRLQVHFIPSITSLTKKKRNRNSRLNF